MNGYKERNYGATATTILQASLSIRIDYVPEEDNDKIRGWKKSPKKYWVHAIPQGYTCNDKEDYSNSIGNLDELYDQLSGQDFSSSETVFTDAHTGTFRIKIGEEVSMPREDCDQNRNAQCSAGLICSPAA